MKGNNSMTLNQATMQEAIAFWLNQSQLSNAVDVKKISLANDMQGSFTVEFSELEPETEE